MTERPRRSAPLLVRGLIAALLLGPAAILAALALSATSLTASYYGLLQGPGTGTLLLFAAGGVLVLAGWIAVIIGVHRLASTVDVLGSIAAGQAPR
ncbi:hypothetical protein [Arthrobacter sp. JSM 101049]|uniref:hypothetical protein n=1 Tax=Arthrobacter sp. JSM 101049 TaxID=929097 RepID=UPI003563A8B3